MTTHLAPDQALRRALRHARALAEIVLAHKRNKVLDGRANLNAYYLLEALDIVDPPAGAAEQPPVPARYRKAAQKALENRRQG